jgi:hypothetical protein
MDFKNDDPLPWVACAGKSKWCSYLCLGELLHQARYVILLIDHWLSPEDETKYYLWSVIHLRVRHDLNSPRSIHEFTPAWKVLDLTILYVQEFIYIYRTRLPLFLCDMSRSTDARNTRQNSGVLCWHQLKIYPTTYELDIVGSWRKERR